MASMALPGTSSAASRYPAGGLAFPHRDLLGIGRLERHEILYLLDEAEQWVELNRRSAKRADALAGLTIINAFFENSTRTLLSFEIAGKRLGADVVNMHAATSSVKKGETLIDTAITLNAMRADAILIRHASSGAVALIADKVDCPVLNAGDGSHEHPTQALLDALTLRHALRARGEAGDDFTGQTIAICGDIANSRVARSNIHLLSTLGAEIRLVCPATLLPDAVDAMGVEIHTNLEQGIEGVDIVMMLRLQTERMEGTETPSQREYFNMFGLDRRKLMRAAPNALIMHPGPMNRGVEIDSATADDVEKSLIRTQVEIGVAARMACLEAVATKEGAA